MRKLPAYLLAILIGGIIWFFFSHFKIQGTESVRVVPKTEEELNRSEAEEGIVAENPTTGSAGETGVVNRNRDFMSTNTHGTKEPIEAPVGSEMPSGIQMVPTNLTISQKRSPETIRIASFYLHHFGSTAADPLTTKIAAAVIQHFDIVALQGIMPGGNLALKELAAQVGPNYQVLVGAPADVRDQDERFAYIFNSDTIVADRGVGLYTLGDIDNLLWREPLIGWFRAKEAAEEEAFTFTLVNVNVHERYLKQELDVLDNAMHEIRNDGREEDDVIMLGSFKASHDRLGELGRVPSLVKAIRRPTTDLVGQTQTENILFRSIATDEFVEQAGVLPFRQKMNLTLSAAQGLSDYLPVWADFSIYETGRRGGLVSAAQGGEHR